MSNKSRSRRSERQAQQQRARRQRTILIAAGGALFLLVVIFFTWQQTLGTNALDPDLVADPALGAAGAAVEIVEYGDFGCPACRAWHSAGIREQIVQTYGDQVRFVWRDFPVITPQSPKAAEAAQCAGAQGQFWAYHDAIYDGAAGISEQALGQYAAEIGLDQAVFAACLEEGQMARKVDAGEQQARRLGLRGTPGFTVNGAPLAAPPSYEQLAALVEAATAQ